MLFSLPSRKSFSFPVSRLPVSARDSFLLFKKRHVTLNISGNLLLKLKKILSKPPLKRKRGPCGVARTATAQRVREEGRGLSLARILPPPTTHRRGKPASPPAPSLTGEEEIVLQWWESLDKTQLLPLTIIGLRRKIPDCDSCSQLPFLHSHQLCITQH